MPTRSALFTKHQYLAERMTGDWHIAGADRDDVVQELRIALWEATGSWDPSYGVPFPQFAREVMKRRMADVITKANRLKHQILSYAVRNAASRFDGEVVEVFDYVASRELGTEELVLQLDELRGLIGAILGLTERQRTAVIRVINGLACIDKVDDNALQGARRKLRKIRDAA